jgi:hypothetical protein
MVGPPDQFWGTLRSGWPSSRRQWTVIRWPRRGAHSSSRPFAVQIRTAIGQNQAFPRRFYRAEARRARSKEKEKKFSPRSLRLCASPRLSGFGCGLPRCVFGSLRLCVKTQSNRKRIRLTLMGEAPAEPGFPAAKSRRASCSSYFAEAPLTN